MFRIHSEQTENLYWTLDSPDRFYLILYWDKDLGLEFTSFIRALKAPKILATYAYKNLFLFLEFKNLKLSIDITEISVRLSVCNPIPISVLT